MKDKLNQEGTAITDREPSQSLGKIKKPNRKKVESPRILINDRKKASYDLYTIGTKPQE